MNLRLSENSIRLRMEVAEAEQLMMQGELHQEICQDLSLNVTLVESENVSMAPWSSGSFTFFLPLKDFSNLLCVAKKSSRKNDLTLSKEISIGNSPVELRFEIDHFSSRKAVSKNRQLLTNNAERSQ